MAIITLSTPDVSQVRITHESWKHCEKTRIYLRRNTLFVISGASHENRQFNENWTTNSQ